MHFKKISLVGLLAGLLVWSAGFATAQDTVSIQNKWRMGYVGVDGANPVLRAEAGQKDTTWTLEPVPGETPGTFSPYYRLRSSSGDYLHAEGDRLEVGPAPSGWYSAMWVRQPLADGSSRLINRWKSGLALHTENGAVELGNYEEGWLSAMWIIAPVTPTVASPTRPTDTTFTDTSVVADLTVNNRSRQQITIFYYDDSGSKQIFAQVSPNFGADLKTYPDVTWAFQNGEILVKSYIATTAASQTVEITDSDLAAATSAPPVVPPVAPPVAPGAPGGLAGQAGGFDDPGQFDGGSGDFAGTQDQAICRLPDGSRGQRMRLTSPRQERSASRHQQFAGVNRMFQMAQDGSCAVTYTLEPFIVEQIPTSATVSREIFKTMPPMIRQMLASTINGRFPEARLEFTPSVVAWIDDETDELFVTLDSGENLFLQLANYSDSNHYRGPFLKDFQAEVTTPGGFTVRKRWPVNNQTSTSVSKSQGFSLNANLNVSPMVEMSGAGAGAGLNFDTTTSETYDDFAVKVTTTSNSTTYRYKLCGVGSNARESENCTYARADDLIARDRGSSFGQTTALHAIPALGYSFNLGRSITTFNAVREPPGGIIQLNIRMKLTFASGRLKDRLKNDAQAVAEGFFFWANPNFYAGELQYVFEADPDKTYSHDFVVMIDVDQLRSQMR